MSDLQQKVLVKCIKANDIKGVKQLLEENEQLCATDANVRKGDSPLHVAAREGSSEVVGVLLNKVPVNIANNDGKTALHEAATHGHEDVIRLLLESGAEVDALKAADWTPLMMACAKCHLASVKTLIQAGASLTRVNKDGWNAFHIATREGDVSIMNCLLDAKGDCWKTVSKNGRSPLHTAVINGKYEGTKLLLSSRCGYDVEAKDSCISTPLMDALRKGYIELAKLLLSHGSSLLTCNTLGQNCFHVVAEAGQISSLHFISDYIGGKVGTYLNQVDGRNTTCLHLAAKEGHDEMIEALLKLGADPSQTDAKGRTAMDVAALCNHMDCVLKLKSGQM